VTQARQLAAWHLERPRTLVGDQKTLQSQGKEGEMQARSRWSPSLDLGIFDLAALLPTCLALR